MSGFDEGVLGGRKTRSQRHRNRSAAVLLAALALLLAACGSTTASSDDESTGADRSADDQGAENPTVDDAGGSATDGDNEPETSNTTADRQPTTEDEDGGSDDDDESTVMTADERAEAEAAAVAFSQCVRDEGIDMPDLGISPDGSLDLTELLQTVDPQDPTVKRVILACQGALGTGLVGGLSQLLNSNTFDTALSEFSDCVRDKGYTVKELSLNSLVGAMLRGGPGPDPRGIDGSVDPILAIALGLDPDDIDVLEAVDGCAADVQAGLAAMDLDDLRAEE